MNKPRVIMTSGMNHSGKSTFAKTLEKKNDRFVVIENDERRLFAQKQYQTIFKETHEKNYSDFDNPPLKIFHMKSMAEYAIKNGFNPIIANCNTRKEYRKKHIDYFHQQGANVAIVYFDLPYDLLLERAKEAHKHKDPSIYSNVVTGKGGCVANLEWMKKNFEPPKALEAEAFFRITSNEQVHSIISEIEKIL